ncbi:PREDICTED: uncharacterized protein LOC105570940 [Vollenhovia emeryi]|uniref:uncharacterized protein LOC105570940 n=1 Tax=Vollenhovia emeryi TaxID=411798 RepID=UPI0005F571BF|nr:PREDICTED: uncharacterized protein LOC105570940 [Vollenhovia emeryi]XP_011883785.1 PREDICTED: uncharacterized protein LOC105570940 [Vollenhovia emeryi]XP_011883786.1 PREDICTED: uncharacterized protein LOC105570940 [Vollenhovia emeryi]
MSKDSVTKQLDAVIPCSNFKQPSKRKRDETKKNDEDRSTETPYPIILDDIPVDILNMPPISDNIIALQDHIDSKIEQLRNELICQITSVKRSILYDLERKITEIKHTTVIY